MSNNKANTNTRTEAPTAPVGTLETPATKPAAKAKAAKAETDGETTDRLPTRVKELKETKGGFVATLFLAAKDKDAIAKELKVAFKLSEAQAVKVTRLITGRVRLYQRIFELVPVKK